MSPDDEVCLCFHVTRRKLINFVRVQQPRRASQLTECGGAGTGCGWCRPFLERIFLQFQSNHACSDSGTAAKEAETMDATAAPEKLLTPDPDQNPQINLEISVEEYAQLRAQYLREQKNQNKPPPDNR